MNVKISRLSNGLIVASNPMDQLESAAVGVWVNTGTRCEVRAQMGISHMLEHMAFKGTKRRSARELSFEIEAVGGILNAYTGREQTAYHARVLKDDVPLAMDILGDILINPTYATEELARERQVVLQEIGEVRDTPDDLIFDTLQELAYPDQSMGWPVLGEEATVNAMQSNDLFDYLHSHYRAGDMVLAASGAIDHDAILAMAEEKFATLAEGTGAVPAPARFVGGHSRDLSDLEQAHVAMALPGVASNDPDYFAAQVYVTALGGGMSSRLFQEAREKRGLCYSIYAYAQCARDSGVVGVYTGTSQAGAAEIGPVIAGEMANLAETAHEEEVARAKAQLKAGLLMGLERPGTRIEMIAGHMFHYGKVLTVAELTEKLDAVTVADVRRFGAKLMQGRPALAVSGPAAGFEAYDSFAGRFGGAA
ncbi:MAG: pitrilysin family protein [Rhizomicrobium sp.]